MSYPLPARPAPLSRSAAAWWLAVGCWFTGSTVGQFANDPAAVVYDYSYAPIQPGPLAVVLFGIASVFLASLVLPMRDGARWSRVLLTVLAAPMALVLVWQLARTAPAVRATAADLAQGMLCVVALCALACALDLMYRPEARTYYRQRGDDAR